MKTALTIAGSDSSGGAGIQADIKTMTMHGVYAMSAVTALTAQNTVGVRAILESSPEFLSQQIDAVYEDIFPDAVKIGMTASAKLIRAISECLRRHRATQIVVDPVMLSTSGHALLKQDAVETLKNELFPLASVITPNIPEAEALSGLPIQGKNDRIAAARQLGDAYGCAVLLKGGHGADDADDLLYANGNFLWFQGKRINNPNTHGTGCTFSAAIAANLANGLPLAASIERAKGYLSSARSAMLDLGHGSGPMNHAFRITKP